MSALTHVGVCDRSRKRMYASKNAARRANSGNGLRLRVYVCPACHAWHVTKEPKA